MKPTLEFEKRILILFSLFKQNLAASKKDVLDYLRENNLVNLNREDLELRDTNNEEKWRNSFAFIRHHLVENRYLEANKYNKWQLNEFGLMYFRSLVNELDNNNYNEFRCLTEKAFSLIGNIDINSVLQETNLSSSVSEDLQVFESEEKYFEGKKILRFTNYYERKPHLRTKAVMIHGLTCMACEFNFKDFYGERGDNYIEVHHIKPVSKLTEETIVKPETDMIVLCANCHRIIHRRHKVLSLTELKSIIKTYN